jgi:glycosyltransferase involved in cell wall biosynthesis
MNFKVSILLFFKEDRGWLQDAIDSVYSQDYDGNIQLIRSDKMNPNHHKMNASQNLNFLLQFVKGDYVKYLCEDDMLTTVSIKESVKAMQEQGCDVIHGNSINRYMTGESYRDELYRPKLTVPTIETLKRGNYIHGGTLMYKAEIFKDFKFDESLTCAEEMDLNLNLLKHGKKFGYCNKFLYIYRRHEAQKSLGKKVDQSERKQRIQAIYDRY